MPIRLHFVKRSVDATTPALVARGIGEGHAPQIRTSVLPVMLLRAFRWTTGANADIWKRKFLANEPEPTQDDEED